MLGKKIKRQGKIVEAVDVFVGGRSGIDPKPATKLLEDVPCDELHTVLAGILPYHSREKMHKEKVKTRVKKTPPSSLSQVNEVEGVLDKNIPLKIQEKSSAACLVS
jgi:ferredoxin-nitrite reductase